MPASSIHNPSGATLAGAPADLAAAAMARRHRSAADHIGGAAGHSADPRRTEPERDRGRHSDRPAVDAVRVCRGSRLAADRAARRARRAGGRPERSPRIGGALRGAAAGRRSGSMP